MAEYSVRVPEPIQAGFDLLVNLPKGAFEELFRAVNQASPSSDLRLLMARVAHKISGVDADSLTEIAQAITSFVGGAGILGMTYEEFTHAIVQGSADRLTVAKQKRITERLLRIFGSDSFVLTSKALNVRQEAQNTLVAGRIMTDIRPVFYDDPSKQPGAVMIIHTLKLVYHADDEHKEIFISLDDADLVMLETAISRAKAKEQSLMNMMKSGEFHLIETEGE